MVKVYLAEVGSLATRSFFICFVQTEEAAPGMSEYRCVKASGENHWGAVICSRDTHLQQHRTLLHT